jgi:hypothetical protein
MVAADGSGQITPLLTTSASERHARLVNVSVEDENSAPITVVLNWQAGLSANLRLGGA